MAARHGSERAVELPEALHAQLYLLAYDRHRRRFCTERETLFGFALRAAMLTDLYLSGFLEDRQGRPCPTDSARHKDPLLQGMVVGIGQRSWGQLIASDERATRQHVRQQLEADGWLVVRHHRFAGMIPAQRLGVLDEQMVGGLADRVTAALHNAMLGRPAGPRPLAVGLIGVLGQMSTVLSLDECSLYQGRLRELICATIEPIFGLKQAVEAHHAEMRANLCSGC
ncbi:GPP34 family phosphoprotein [Mycobacterium sp. PS03-16]|uniref:GOLPH3/VPS74 family protein n=1 Tax=Mycobacterium sp. PS03-16 TaxID=2559611 RepID=UPI00142F4147|nr:GPP34 family phosphoprotein [Mycobacterium sp. PS03-16]